MATFTSPKDELFFAAVGRLTLCWAHLEFFLDCMVAATHAHMGGKEIEKQIPRALQRKLTYLRAIIKRLPLPPDAVQGYLDLFDGIETAAETRHDIIHGAVIDQVEGSGEAKMVRLLRGESGNIPKHFTVTTAGILEATRNIQRLTNKLTLWVSGYIELIEELQKQHDEQKQS